MQAAEADMDGQEGGRVRSGVFIYLNFLIGALF